MLLAAVMAIAVLYGIVQGYFGKPVKRVSLGDAIKALYRPGGFFYERNERVRPHMERLGLTSHFWGHNPLDGPVVWFPQRLRRYGGPFQLLRAPFDEVHQGTHDGIQITIGCVTLGDVDSREEHMAAIFAVPGTIFPTFTASSRRVKGEDRATSFLAGPIHDWLATHPDWALEGKEDKLVVYRKSKPQDPSGYLTPEEITAFVDEALGAAALLSVRVPRV